MSHRFFVACLSCLLLSRGLLAAEADPFRPPAAEIRFQEAARSLKDFDGKLSTGTRRVLKNAGSKDRENLDGTFRRLYDQREPLKNEARYWEDVVRLKKELLALEMDHAPSAEEVATRDREAEAMARVAIRGFGELRAKYQMLRPAVLQNILINTGFKEEGFCWHWTRDFFKRLRGLGDLKAFDLTWATAHMGTVREHNTIVVSSRGVGFERGLLLDGWRHSGSPFWTLVAKDKRYPWKLGSFAGTEDE